MIPHNTSNPVSLSYVAALRGLAPRKPGTSFTYAMVGCKKPWLLMCLAASNPEGRFFGLMADPVACGEAQAQTRACRLDNVSFLTATAQDAAGGKASLPPLNYLCLDESEASLSASERQTVFDLAAASLLPGGLFNYTYRAYANEDGPLRFLVREFAPEMNVQQAKNFLQELKTLGTDYFAGHPAATLRLEDALKRDVPDMFFGDYDDGEARSGSFDTTVALRPRGFLYVGDSNIGTNYIDLAATPEAQKVILTCLENFLYEPIKDFTLNRTIRSDVWCRGPVSQTSDLVELFGFFSYGIVMPKNRIPAEVKAKGRTVDLTLPVFKKLIGLMTLMPLSIGDFLQHPEGRGAEPVDVIGAIQTLVACGIAQPMRGLYQAGDISNVAQPRFAGALNRYMGQTEVSSKEIWLASPVLGGAMNVSPREALVMQALDRAGLANSVAVLLPELQRLARNPVDAMRIMDANEATPEIAHHMIEDTVSNSIVQWYAYGLLEAA